MTATVAAPALAGTGRWPARLGGLAAPALAAGLVGFGLLMGWRGVDLPAQAYRQGLVTRYGLTIWDSQWYGGHWTLDYSLISPALTALIGVGTVLVLSAAIAAWAFDRLAVGHFGRPGRAASLVFAASTIVASSIGQVPYLSGEALALGACWAASRRRWAAAGVLGVAASAASPLAGAFLMLAMASWAMVGWGLAGRRAQRAGAAAVALCAAVPIGATALLFPGEGAMPYPFTDYAWEMVVAAAVWILVGEHEPVVRAGVVIFGAAATGSFLIASPVGGNVGRIADSLALPLAVATMWGRRRLLLAAVAVPLVLSQWAQAWGALTTNASQPSTHRAFYIPLVQRLAAAGGPAGRVEVVPTRFHWEVDYVAPVMALARGWERQLDVTDNPLFYRPGLLDPSSYRAWLVANGVRFVALPRAPLDFAGVAEARLLERGVPGLRVVWHSANWTLFRVRGSSGIVAAPAVLVAQRNDRLTVATPRAGPVLVRVRWNAYWTVTAGAGCTTEAAGGWTTVQTPRAETLRLGLRLGGLSAGGHCRR